MDMISYTSNTKLHYMYYYCILRGWIKGFNSSITTIMCQGGSWGEPERAPH